MEEGQKTLTPWLYHSLSPHSICKKSPNLLPALFPPRLIQACYNAEGWCSPVLELVVPGRAVIRPEKECIKSCET